MHDETITIEVPSQLTETETRVCIELIVAGNAVDRTHVEYWFTRSVSVAIKRWDNEIAGVGVIKPARCDYVETVAKRSGVVLPSDMNELGYITVSERFRGQKISHAIVQALISAYEVSLFATTSNPRMQRTLENFGFEQKGNTWHGNRGDELSLWVKI